MADDKTVVTKKTAVKAATAAPAPVSKKTAAKKTAVKATPPPPAPAATPAPVPVQAAESDSTSAVKKTAAKAAPKKTAAKGVGASVGQPLEDRPVTLTPLGEVTPEQRWRMIADAAYYRAERRNFAPGHEYEDWLAAEAEVEEVLRSRRT